MDNLFESNKTDETAGFRLMYAEFFNWGTFSNTVKGDIVAKPYRITPTGCTVALQGKKGTGKSTLVDGLITLLVRPPRNKHLLYNQASGISEENKKSKGRTAESYFWGNYNEILDENENIKAQALREVKDNHHTVLLACFDNGIQRVTLAQVWFWNIDKIQKIYLVAPKALKIEDHFSSLSYTAKDIRKQLEILAPETKVFTDDFSGYQSCLRDILGIKSEEALKLFHKIIGSKELGSVDNVVKTFILQDGTAEINARIDQMYQSNDTLINIKKMMENAEKELILLEPIVTKGTEYSQLTAEINRIQALIKQLPAYMSLQRERLLTIEIEVNDREIKELEIRLDEIKDKLEKLRKEEARITTAKNEIDIQRIIEGKETNLNETNEKVKTKKAAAAGYEAIAKKIDYPAVGDNEKSFRSNYKNANAEKSVLETNISLGNNVFTDLIANQKVLEPQYQTKLKELQDLRKRPNSNIPTDNQIVRERIVKELGIKETEIPFIGELIEVKPEHKNWRVAIEKLLRSFALNMLVPEKYERKVNRFVSQNNMKGLVTYKAVGVIAIQGYRNIVNDGIVSKLELKQTEPFHRFLKNILIKDFDYECFDEENDAFRKSKQPAITVTGLQNSNGNYRKDDRDLRPILGWDTFANIEFAKDEVERLYQQKQQLDKQIQHQNTELGKQKERIETINAFLKIESFASIDFKQDEKDAHKLEIEITKLRNTPKNDQLKALEKEIKPIEAEIKEIAAEQLSKNTKKSNLEERNKIYEKVLEDTKKENKNIDLANVEPFIADFEGYFAQKSLTANDFELQQEKAKNNFVNNLNDNVNRRNQNKERLEANMRDYLREFPSASLYSRVESLEGFEKRQQFIKNEDLPKHKQDFEHNLKEDFTNSFVNFRTFLEETQLNQIDNDLRETNRMLEKIRFDKNLYIQLAKRETVVSDEIRNFRKQLKEVLEGSVGINNDQAVLEARFNKIQALLKDFKDYPQAQQRRTDVRNWVSVHINKYKWGTKDSVGSQQDSATKSGGQQTMLTYVILASAIARQFGLSNNTQHSISKSFRFVILDEAFSKLDGDDPAVVMQMFKDLRLQLMVIIPDRDRLSAIPEYLGWLHHISNNEEGNKSEILQAELNYDVQKFRALGA